MKKTKPEPESNPTGAAPVLTFGELMAHLFTAGIDLRFGHMPDNPPGKRFGGCVNGEEAFSSDPVTAVLEALALGVRAEQAKTARHSEKLAIRKERLAKITELVPGIAAHTPVEDGKCPCGQDHSSEIEPAVDALMAGVAERLGLKVAKIVQGSGPRPKKDRAKKAN